MDNPDAHNRFDPTQFRGLENAVAKFQRENVGDLETQFSAAYELAERLQKEDMRFHVHDNLEKWYSSAVLGIAGSTEGLTDQTGTLNLSHLEKKVQDLSAGDIYRTLKKQNTELLRSLGYSDEHINNLVGEKSTDKQAVLNQAREIDRLVGTRDGEQGLQQLLVSLEGSQRGIRVKDLYQTLRGIKDRGKERYANAAVSRIVSFTDGLYFDQLEKKQALYKYADHGPLTVNDKDVFTLYSLPEHFNIYTSARQGAVDTDTAAQIGAKPLGQAPRNSPLELVKPPGSEYKKAA